MDDEDKKKDDEVNKEKVKIGGKDILAAIIAEFEILMPIAIIACVVFALLLLVFSKWFSK